MKSLPILALMLSLGLTCACTSSRQVQRVDATSTTDLSGRWNDTDARLTAEAMIDQVLTESWLTDFQRSHDGTRPVIVVGLIDNKTSEHIDANLFIKDIERAFLKDKRVRVVQASEKREQLRRERAEQQDFASQETAKKWGKELGADFMLQGSIGSIVDEYKKDKFVFYKINLELTNIETNEIVWIGDKEIKKLVTN